MKIANEDTLIFHTDAIPSEQLNLENPNEVITVAAVYCNNPEHITKNYRHYKNVRKFKTKLKLANKLTSDIVANDIDVRVISVMSDMRTVQNVGEVLLSELNSNADNFSIIASGYVFDGNRISKNRGLVCAWYSLILAKIARHVGNYTERMKLKRFFIGLDTLPHDDPDKGGMIGLEFLNFLTSNTPIKDSWEETANTFKLDRNCGFGYLGVTVDVDEKVKTAKNEGIPILADWLVQNIHAAVNPDIFKNPIDGRERSEEDRMTIASPIFELDKKGHWKHIRL